MWEVQPCNSPYHYAYNDPINGSDGSGMYPVTARVSESDDDPITGEEEDDGSGDSGGSGGGGYADGWDTWSGYAQHITERLFAVAMVPMGPQLSGIPGLDNGTTGRKTLSGGNTIGVGGQYTGTVSVVPQESPRSMPMSSELYNFVKGAAMQTEEGKFLWNEIQSLLNKGPHTVTWLQWEGFIGYSAMTALDINGAHTYGVGSSVNAVFSPVIMSLDYYKFTIFHVVHELSHIYNDLLGNTWPGYAMTTPRRIAWAEVQAMDWENSARMNRKLPRIPTYTIDGFDVTLPVYRPQRNGLNQWDRFVRPDY